MSDMRFGNPYDQAESVGQLFAKNGVEVPDGAKRMFATWSTILEVLDDAAVVSDLMAAVQGGKRAEIVAAVREAALSKVVASGTRELLPELATSLGNQALAFLRADTGRVIDELRPRFLEAAGKVVEALKFFTPLSFENPGEILKRSGEAGDAFRAVYPAMVSLDLMAELVIGVSKFIATRSPVALLFVGDDGSMVASDLAPAWATPGSRWLSVYALQGVSPALNSPADAVAIGKAATAREQAELSKPRALSAFEAARAANDRRDARRLAESVPQGPPPAA